MMCTAWKPVILPFFTKQEKNRHCRRHIAPRSRQWISEPICLENDARAQSSPPTNSKIRSMIRSIRDERYPNKIPATQIANLLLAKNVGGHHRHAMENPMQRGLIMPRRRPSAMEFFATYQRRATLERSERNLKTHQTIATARSNKPRARFPASNMT